MNCRGDKNVEWRVRIILKEVVIVYIKVLCQHKPVGTEENHRNPH